MRKAHAARAQSEEAEARSQASAVHAIHVTSSWQSSSPKHPAGRLLTLLAAGRLTDFLQQGQGRILGVHTDAAGSAQQRSLLLSVGVNDCEASPGLAIIVILE